MQLGWTLKDEMLRDDRDLPGQGAELGESGVGALGGSDEAEARGGTDTAWMPGPLEGSQRVT